MSLEHARTIRNVVKSFESNFADIPGQYQDQKSALMALRVVSNALELDLPLRPIPPDPINPSHYQGDYVMRIIEDFSLDFLDGQVVKYVLRSGKKDLSPAINDYKKALWYLTRKIKNLEKE